MAMGLKKGQHIFIPFQGEGVVLDSQFRPRMYNSRDQFERCFPAWRDGKAELVEYAPVLAPSSDPLTPCDLCRYNPPSSFGGKPCCACPAEKGSIERIKNAPTVDAVPVVRCKDCIRWDPDGTYEVDSYGARRMYGACTRTCMHCKDDHFCSYGRKKDEKNTDAI